MWEQTKVALDFFKTYLPYHEMKAANDLSDNPEVLVFAKEEEIYLLYMKSPQVVKVDLGTSGKTFSLDWFNPQQGGALHKGTVETVKAANPVAIGLHPADWTKDWLCLIRVVD